MSNKKIKKAIIPAGGFGISFLPATKALPKEMLPIVDKPALQYIVEEAVNSGIEEILIITGRNKSSIENHFDKSVELECSLIDKNDIKNLKKVQDISDLANIYYVRQRERKGIADAINCAKSFVEDEDYFAILLGDDVIDSKVPCLKQLIDVHSRYTTPIIGVQDVKRKEVSKYGIIESIEVEDGVHKVRSLIEKPDKKISSSTKGIMGRYIVSPSIFKIIENQKPGKRGEIELTDTLNTLLDNVSIYACDIEGNKYDLSNKLEYLEANIDFALKRDDMKDEMIKVMKNKIKNIK